MRLRFALTLYLTSLVFLFPVSRASAAITGKVGLWNGFLGMVDIVEIVNSSLSDQLVELKLYSIDGSLTSTTTFTIPADSQQDVILNDIQGFAADSYGIIEVSNNVGGRVLYYKVSGAGFSDFDFAFAVDLSESLQNKSYVGFNTYQPSFNPADTGRLVANWLSIVNLEDSQKSFDVRKYDQSGALLSSASYNIAAHARFDVEGGHENPGPSNVGLIEVTPADLTGGYLAQLMRYGFGQNNTFDFAFPLVARNAHISDRSLPYGNAYNVQNWLEIINPAISTQTVRFFVYGKQGNEIAHQQFDIGPHAQTHINLSSFGSDIGQVIVGSIAFSPIIAESMFYFRTSSGSISAMYGSQQDSPTVSDGTGSFNLYLGMENYLRIMNATENPQDIEVTISSAFSAGSSRTVTLPALGTVELPLHETATYGTALNTYGTVNLVSHTAGAGQYIFSEIVRVKKDASGQIEFAAPTGLRQN